MLLAREPMDAGVKDEWLGRDKLAHFAVSTASVAFANHLLLMENGNNSSLARNRSVVFCLSLGLAKEIRDGTQRDNRFSLKDIAADLAGTTLGVFLFTF
jgi:uncharacterized protein YfiM (DUF2279 family)